MLRGAFLASVGLAEALCVLVLLARHRRSTRRAEGLFTCRLRAADAGDSRGSTSWPRRRVKARWVHDVLVVRRGGWSLGTELLPVSRVHGRLGPTVTVRGKQWVSLRLELDDGSVMDVAAPRDLADELGGPFLTAHDTLGEAHGYRRRGR